MNIKFVNHKDIDFEKWDNTIEKSVNGIVYACSWYLNIVNPNWPALIAGDYDIVMPLTSKKKYGIRYLYKSFFSQFLGVFYKNEKHDKFVKPFLNEASRHYKFIEINLNVHNSSFEADYCSLKQTQVLSLSDDYEIIKSNFDKSHRKNIRKANNEDLIVKRDLDYAPLINLIRLMYEDRQVHIITEKDYIDLENIVKYALNNKLGEIYYAYSDGEICAAAFFLKWKGRVQLQTGINEIGKKTLALFKILDSYMQFNAETDLLLDFAGSNILGVAHWNKAFGAETLHYYTVKINNLPIPFKWLKK